MRLHRQLGRHDNIDVFPETIGQVSFEYNEVARELDELSAYKEQVRHQFKTVFKQLQEISIRGDIEGRLISSAFGDDYPQGDTGRHRNGRHHRGTTKATSYSYPLRRQYDIHRQLDNIPDT